MINFYLTSIRSNHQPMALNLPVTNSPRSTETSFSSRAMNVYSTMYLPQISFANGKKSGSELRLACDCFSIELCRSISPVIVLSSSKSAVNSTVPSIRSFTVAVDTLLFMILFGCCTPTDCSRGNFFLMAKSANCVLYGAQYECGMKPSCRVSWPITYTQSFSRYKILTICPRFTSSSSSTHGVKSWRTTIFESGDNPCSFSIPTRTSVSILAEPVIRPSPWFKPSPLLDRDKSLSMSPPSANLDKKQRKQKWLFQQQI